MRPRAPIVALCLLLGSLGLVACGGGGGSSTASSAAPAPAAGSSASGSSPGAEAAASKPSSPGEAKASEPPVSSQRRAAGRAAPFVKPKADNSVPTFGAEAGAGERGEAEVDLKAYLQARASGDWAAACRYLAASARQGFEALAKGKGSCAGVLAALSKGADRSDPLSGRLLSLRVSGANAFALFYGPHHQQYIVPMSREGGRWNPTQTAPIAYPVGAP